MMRILLLGFALFFAGCALFSKGYVDGDQAPGSVKKRFPRYTSARDCSSHGGQWRPTRDPAIFPHGGYCILKTADGGKACKSSDDCQGYCELSFDEDAQKPKCSPTMPPRWDRCIPGYYEDGKVLSRGECFGDDSEVQ